MSLYIIAGYFLLWIFLVKKRYRYDGFRYGDVFCYMIDADIIFTMQKFSDLKVLRYEMCLLCICFTMISFLQIIRFDVNLSSLFIYSPTQFVVLIFCCTIDNTGCSPNWYAWICVLSVWVSEFVMGWSLACQIFAMNIFRYANSSLWNLVAMGMFRWDGVSVCKRLRYVLRYGDCYHYGKLFIMENVRCDGVSIWR